MNLKRIIKELLNMVLVSISLLIFIVLFMQYIDSVTRNIKTFSDWVFMLLIPMIAYTNIFFKQPKKNCKILKSKRS